MKLGYLVGLAVLGTVLAQPAAQAAMSKQQAIEECRAQAVAQRMASGRGDPQVFMRNCVRQKMGAK